MSSAEEEDKIFRGVLIPRKLDHVLDQLKAFKGITRSDAVTQGLELFIEEQRKSRSI